MSSPRVPDLPPHAVAMLQSALRLPPEASPFPWQRRLLARFLNPKIKLPSALDLPTGLGKTKVMTVWAVARALGAGAKNRLPRRLVYVVDRRAVVDQATREAELLIEWIRDDEEARAAFLHEEPLVISTLRGQYADNRKWLEDPSRPAIIVGTVDMIGSRVLFEGYGVSRKMRPYHAGLLGIDTLFVLDEAHLVPPFEGMIRDLTRRATELDLKGRSPDCIEFPPTSLISLSATARSSDEDTFGLEESDEAHLVVKQRLEAEKHLRFEPVPNAKSMATRLAERAWAASDEGKQNCRVLVFCNKRDDAEKAMATLRQQALRSLGKPKRGEPEKVDTELFVGGRRVYERSEASKRLEGLGFIAGTEGELERPAFLFATSAAEVGVDLDADHMVCDLVQFERMVQRLGRVNRRGGKTSEVHVLCDVSAAEATKKDERARAERIRAQRALLEAVARHDDGTYDASPGALKALTKKIHEDEKLKDLHRLATSEAPLRPELERALVDAWSMTSLREHTGRPEVAPWLRGWIDEEPRTTVIWRGYSPPIKELTARRAKVALEAFFEAAPPHQLEKLELETRRIADWLSSRAAALDKRNSSADLVLIALEPSLDVRAIWPLKDLPRDKKRLERELRGAVLIVPTQFGGLSASGLLDPKADTPPETPEPPGSFGEPGPVPFRVLVETADAPLQTEGEWRERYRTPLEVNETGDVVQWLVVHNEGVDAERPTAARAQTLEEHQQWAEGRARQIAQALRLPERFETLLTLATRLHDEGKRAARWQRAFNAPAGVWAKTKGPVNPRLLDGYRHELGSLDYVERDQGFQQLEEPDKDLVLHLVAAHHGFARPVISTSGFDDLPPSAVEARAREVALRFIRLQDAWGPWGLAWWEALLRAADQWASRKNDREANEVSS